MPYNPALDGLRAIAICLVILFHARVPGYTGGFLGVDVFFVLSGFLITSLLAREVMDAGCVNLGKFYFRRLIRLTPALIAMLAAYLAAASLLWPDVADHAQQAMLAAAYLSDYGVAFWGNPDQLSHTWSLAVEEHFYLIWPIIIGATLRRYGARQVLLVLLGTYVVAVVWTWACIHQGQSWNQVYYRFDTNVSGLLLGSALALAVQDQQIRPVLDRTARCFVWLPLALLVCLQFRWGDEWLLTLGTGVAELTTAVALLAMHKRAGAAYEILSVSGLVWIGRLSYSLYLWHYPIFYFLRAHLEWYGILLLGLPLSLALAALSYYTVERWALRLRHALRVRHSVSAAV